MRKIINLCVLLALSASMALLAKGQDARITVDKLPANSRDFLQTHFREMEISYVEVEKDLMWIRGYEVILIDGTEICFSRKGEWTEVERQKNAVPPALIPREIAQYVAQYFSGKTILAIERESRKWEIKLDNRMELAFDRRGRLVEQDAD
ncbi:PepSY-like domain-containing protein [Parabacteroides sp. PF5-6]|uniref:PepSY-like domain-containing protein n=1 Tax=Parabacteroides sp. PF5-6 TaxID=1742403 RepID=UPI00240596D7|nr:PepSY-like domain-containing protein [Parabacteroides sp. PF5-6]MDF9830777.1 hypothetical protein [Parabacteroides sp. PF5-6]